MAPSASSISPTVKLRKLTDQVDKRLMLEPGFAFTEKISYLDFVAVPPVGGLACETKNARWLSRQSHHLSTSDCGKSRVVDRT